MFFCKFVALLLILVYFNSFSIKLKNKIYKKLEYFLNIFEI